MSMNTALSGLSAAQTEIATTSHNIANVSTVGFRGSRTEFADIFNQSPNAVSRTTTGSGVQVTRVGQDFSQGSIVGTGNRLDLAIEGAGFFAMRPMTGVQGSEPETLYSRAGAFNMSSDGTIVNASGQQLLGWPVAGNGQLMSEALTMAQPLQVPLSTGTPVATTSVALALNLPADPDMRGAQAAVPPAGNFDPADATTWAHRTALPVFDANGSAVEAEAYLVRMADPSATSAETVYAVHVVRGGAVMPMTAAQDLRLDGDGKPVGATGFTFGRDDDTLALDLSGARLGRDPFEVTAASHNGETLTQLTTLDIDAEGTVWATYGSEDRVARGKLLLVNFANPGGLRVMGAAGFTATAESGAPLAGSPGGAGFGLLRSGALEKANVDLTEELVNLITSQRNYQASAKAMETSSSMMQTIMNIRS